MLGTPDYIAPEQSLDAQKADCGNLGQNQKLTKLERTIQLSRPDELRFQLPQTAHQLARLMTVDALIFPSNPNGPPPNGYISNVVLKARRDRPLGLGLKVVLGQVIVECVESDGIASAARMEVGDILTAVNGKRIPFCGDSSQLPGIAIELGVTPDLRLTLRRDGEERVVTIED